MPTKIISISLPANKLRALDAAARADGRSRSQFVGRAVDQHIRGQSVQTPINSKQGSIPRSPHSTPAAPARSTTDTKVGTELDRTLAHIPKSAREF